MTPEELIDFESEVARQFEAGNIGCPVHLSGGNESQLIEIFKAIDSADYVFSNWRSHYHALLHGIPRARVMAEIMAGRSMNLAFPDHRFFTSAIVGGCLPIAVGVAAALKRQGSARKVWCFVGDMAYSTGTFADANRYSAGHNLPIVFIVEDNGFSADSPTDACWCGDDTRVPWSNVRIYEYERAYPHYGVAKSGGM